MTRHANYTDARRAFYITNAIENDIVYETPTKTETFGICVISTYTLDFAGVIVEKTVFPDNDVLFKVTFDDGRTLEIAPFTGEIWISRSF